MLRHFLLLIIKNDGTVVDRINSIATIDFSKANASNIKDLVGNGFYSTCCTCTEKYSIKFVNASNTGENLQSSESKITDADMAKSILEYSKNSILEQAVQAMLSQTKSGVETVKNLLTT